MKIDIELVKPLKKIHESIFGSRNELEIIKKLSLKANYDIFKGPKDLREAADLIKKPKKNEFNITEVGATNFGLFQPDKKHLNSSINLQFIYMLLNKDSVVGQIFWDAFLTAYLLKTRLNSPFSLKQLTTLLDIVSSQHKNNQKQHKSNQKTKESADLLQALQDFIATNGLIRESTKLHIELEAILDYNPGSGAKALLNISDKYVERFTKKYKQLLVRSVFLMHGVPPMKSIFLEFIDPDIEPSIKELNTLKKHGLIKPASELQRKMYKELIKNVQDEKTEYEEIGANYPMQCELIIDLLNDFRALLWEFLSERPRAPNIIIFDPSLPFYPLLQAAAKRRDALDLLPDSDSCALMILNAVDYLIASIKARRDLSSDFYNSFVTVGDIAIISGITNLKSIINENLKKPSNKNGNKDGELYQEIIDLDELEDIPIENFNQSFRVWWNNIRRIQSNKKAKTKGTIRVPQALRPVNKKAAAKWLKNSSRHNSFVELKISSIEQEFTLEDLETLNL